MNVASRIRHGVAWLFLGSTAYQILSIGFGIILARMLAPEIFGMLVAIQIFTGLAGFIAGGGMGQALVRAKEVQKADWDAVFTIQLFIGCLIYATFFIGAPWIAAWYAVPLYSELLRVSALSFICRPFNNLPNCILSRQMRFGAQTGVRIITLVVSNAVSIVLAFLGGGVWSLIMGGLAASVLGAVLLLSLARWRPALSGEWSRARDFARYGFLTATGDFIVYVRMQTPNFILSKLLGPHLVGLFNKALSLAAFPQSLTGSVSGAAFRPMAKYSGDLNLNQYLYVRSITLVSVYTWPAFIALAWLALPLIRFVYGPNWVGAAPPLTWFALVGPFVILETLSGLVLAVHNWLHREIPVQIAQTVVVVLGVLAGVHYGLVGAAIGASLGNIYGALHLSWLAARCLRLPIRRVFTALALPVALTLPIALLWLAIDKLFVPLLHWSDFQYLLVMSTSGGILYAVLFMLSPTPALAAERSRWAALCSTGAKGFRKFGRDKWTGLP